MSLFTVAHAQQQTMTFASGAAHPGFTFTNWSALNGTIWNANLSADAIITKDVGTFNLISFDVGPFTGANMIQLTSDQLDTLIYDASIVTTHTVNWTGITEIRHTRLSGAAASEDIDNVVVELVPLGCTPALVPTSIAGDTAISAGDSTTLFQVGGLLNGDTAWAWYTGSCYGTLVGTGTSITVAPGQTTTYYVGGIGPCADSLCFDFVVHVATAGGSPPSGVTGDTAICPGDTAMVTQVGGALNSDTTWGWFTGSCYGTLIATGATVMLAPAQTTTYYISSMGQFSDSLCYQFTLNVNGTSVPPDSVFASSDTVCVGDTAMLTKVNGALNGASDWVWFTGGCGVTPVDAGEAITVTAAQTTTYYVGAGGACNGMTICAEYTLTVLDQPNVPLTIQLGQDTICEGDTVEYSVLGQLNGADHWAWYTDSCAGTSFGSGAVILATPDSSGSIFVRPEGCQSLAPCAMGSIVVEYAPMGASITLTFGDSLLASTSADSYQWYLNGQPIANATNQWHVPTESGSYTVEALNANGCESPASAVFLYTHTDTVPDTVPPIGVYEYAAQQLVRVWPNPANDRVFVEVAGSSQPLQYSILSLDGRAVLRGRVGSGNSIDVSGLAKGAYILRLDSEQRMQTLLLRQ